MLLYWADGYGRLLEVLLGVVLEVVLLRVVLLRVVLREVLHRRRAHLVVSKNWRRGRSVCGVRRRWLEVARIVVGYRGVRGPAQWWARHMVPA